MITVIGNLKGGCGKSTIAFNLAIWLVKAGKEVRLLDLDPQGTIRDVADVRDELAVDPTITVLTMEDDPFYDIRQFKGEVIIDVGTEDLETMRKALSLAHRVLVPVPPSQADVWSTQRFLSLILLARKKRLPEIILFINRGDTHPQVQETNETEDALCSLPDVTVLPHRLCQRTAFRRSFSEGQAVFELVSKSNKAAQEFQALARALYPDA